MSLRSYIPKLIVLKNDDAKFLTLDVIIHDLNEFPPKFPNKKIEVQVFEGDLSSLWIDAAKDNDSAKTNIIYSLLPAGTRNLTSREIYTMLEKLNSKIEMSKFTNNKVRINFKTNK
jgi:hypothetical protein